jgi:hypothetical protein
MSDQPYTRIVSPQEFDAQFGERDSRLKVRKLGEKTGIAGPIKDRRIWEPVFCWNCGAAGGFVTAGTPIFYVCKKCDERFGHLPAPMVPGTEDL